MLAFQEALFFAQAPPQQQAQAPPPQQIQVAGQPCGMQVPEKRLNSFAPPVEVSRLLLSTNDIEFPCTAFSKVKTAAMPKKSAVQLLLDNMYYISHLPV